MYKLIEEGRIFLPDDENKRPAYKRYLSEVPGLLSKTILPYELVGHTQSSKQALDRLIGINIFDYPNPVDLIKYFQVLSTNKDSIVLDFFSGFRVIIMTSEISNSGYWVSESIQKNKRRCFL